MTFRDHPVTVTDLSGLNLHWFRPANAADPFYPRRWPGIGILVDLVGTGIRPDA